MGILTCLNEGTPWKQYLYLLNLDLLIQLRMYIFSTINELCENRDDDIFFISTAQHRGY